MNEKRFVLVNKYNPNELMIDNLFVMNGIPQLYDAERCWILCGGY